MNKLIVLEGPDGVGKTTIARKLAARLGGIYCSFPGREVGTLGEQVYGIHHNNELKASPESLQLLHVAAHIDALQNRIIPWLEDDKIVVLDRCYWSTWVYGCVYGVNRKFLSDAIKLELPYWGEWNVVGSSMFYISRDKPWVAKQDDQKALMMWQKLHEYYYHTFASYAWNDFQNRITINNEDSETSVADILEYLSVIA